MSAWRNIKRSLVIAGIAIVTALIVATFLPTRLLFGAPNQLRISDRLNRVDIAVSGLEFARGEFDRICFEPVVYERHVLESLKHDWTFWSWYSADHAMEDFSLVLFVADGNTKYSLVRNLVVQDAKLEDSKGKDCVPLANVSMKLQSMRTNASVNDVEDIDVLISISR